MRIKLEFYKWLHSSLIEWYGGIGEGNQATPRKHVSIQNLKTGLDYKICYRSSGSVAFKNEVAIYFTPLKFINDPFFNLSDRKIN
jgi:hypothetical protein